MFGLMQLVAGMQQRFGGDAADIQAGAAQGFAPFDAGGLEPQLRAADGADIAAGAGADYDDIIAGHGASFGVALSTGQLCMQWHTNNPRLQMYGRFPPIF